MLQSYDPAQQSSLLLGSSSKASPTTISNAKQPEPTPIFVVTGPAGCGKTTVAQYIAKQYSFEYIEGDDYHPKANIDKMANNIPLTDQDRWDWLGLLRDQAIADLQNGGRGVVITCSCLKKKYRDVIRLAPVYAGRTLSVSVHFIYLSASEDVLLARVKGRQGHYMKDTMVLSQLRALEPPTPQEVAIGDVCYVDVSGSQADVAQLTTTTVEQVLAEIGATSQS